MKCTGLCFIFLWVWRCVPLALGENFEYECETLKRLDMMENKVKAAEEVIADLESKDTEKEQLLARLETKVKASDAVIADLETKDKEKDQLLVSLENKVKSSDEVIADLKSNVTKIEHLKDTLMEQLGAKATAGTTYARWGRTSCPGNGSELVYHGVTGGSHFTHSGAAANYLCLPLDPTYGKYYEDIVQHTGGIVYGAEYELSISNRMLFFPDIDSSLDLRDQNVPCAVCHVLREAMLMVPAKATCNPGWTLEYKGLLMSGHYNHVAASEFICLDDQPEAINGGQADENGKLLYFVECRCGSLPCPPYVEGRELTCAVCTK